MSLSLIIPLVIGAAAIFLLLPRPRAFPSLLGGVAGLAAFGLGAWSCLTAIGFSVETFLFLVFSTLAILSGSLLVTQANPARAALSFALVVLSTCGLFLLLAAPFLMAATIIIYAGAIVVTFLFVIMLAQQEGLSDADARSREPLFAVGTGFVLLGALLYVLNLTYGGNENAQLLEAVLREIRQAQAEVEQVSGDVPATRHLEGRVKALTNKVIDELETRGPELEKKGDNQALRALQNRADFAREIRSRFEGVMNETPNPHRLTREEQKGLLARVARPLLDMRQEQGMLRPSAGAMLSPLSGPAANTPVQEMRLDAAGRPQLPADNAQYLGRSLFTDFLLPVELGGTLLLVATVGAIAIAQRRIPPGRPT